MRSVLLSSVAVIALALPAHAGILDSNVTNNVNTNANANTNTNANANVNNNHNWQGQQQGQYQQQYQGQGQGQRQSNNSNVSSNNNNNSNGGSNYNSIQYPNLPASSAVAPSVYASMCNGGFSFGGQGPWPAPGISVGISWLRDFCKVEFLAKSAEERGETAVAKYFRCSTDEWRAAYKATGTPCAQDVQQSERGNGATVQTAAASPTPQVAHSPQCFSASGAVVPIGQRGAVRCQ